MGIFQNRFSQDLVLSDLQMLLSFENGRRFIGWLLLQSGLFSGSYAESSDRATNYNEGLRAMGLLLGNLIEQVKTGELGRLLAETASRLKELEQIQKNQRG